MYTISNPSGRHPFDQLWNFQATSSKLDPKPPYIMAGSSQIDIRMHFFHITNIAPLGYKLKKNLR